MFKGFINQLKNEFKGYNGKRLSKDLMSGMTVAAVALPLALAFGVSCGANAAAGLVTAIIAGLIMGALSGASFQISGPTGAMSAVLITVIAKYNLQGMFIVCLLAGILILLTGVFKLGKIINFIPMPVIVGFTSGISIIIALGQIDNFFETSSVGENAVEKIASYGKLGFAPNLQAVIIGAIAIAIMLIWPKKLNSKIPSSLVAIIIATIISTVLKFDIITVGKIPGTLILDERLDLTKINWRDITGYISPAVTVAALGIIESLLCGVSASRMKNEEFYTDRELIAQGIGNIIIPFFGGIPATAAIARTSVAVKSGCETRLTSIFHAIVLLLSIFLLGPVMSMLPLSALAGVLIVTAYKMNEWSAIKYFFKHKFKGAIIQFTVTMIATVIFDLTVAIIIGVIVGVFAFLLSSMELHIIETVFETERGDKASGKGRTVILNITGALFFANVNELIKRIEGLEEDEKIILSLKGVTNLDSSAAHILIKKIEDLKNQGIIVQLSDPINKVRTVFIRGGILNALGDEIFISSFDKDIVSEMPLSDNSKLNPTFAAE